MQMKKKKMQTFWTWTFGNLGLESVNHGCSLARSDRCFEIQVKR